MPCDRGLSKTQDITADYSATTTESFFQDALCTQESFRFQTVGSLSFNSDESMWINFAYEKVALTLFVPEVVQDFNSRAVCGLTNWSVGVSQTITGLQCAMFNVNRPSQVPRVGDLKFGIYRIEDNQLYYGQLTLEKDGSTAEKRPNFFSPEFFIRKEVQ